MPCSEALYALHISSLDSNGHNLIQNYSGIYGIIRKGKAGRTGNPYKRNKRDCSLEDSSPNVMLGNTPSKELTSERIWDGYMDLPGSSLWDSSATVSAQLRGSSPDRSVVTGIGIPKTSVGLSGTSTKFSSVPSGPPQCSADVLDEGKPLKPP